MDKVCARPACGAEATARFFFDAAARLVILDARVQEWGGSGVLCEEHADKLTSPRGWVIDDRRVLAPRLFPIGRFENPDRAPARVPAGQRSISGWSNAIALVPTVRARLSLHRSARCLVPLSAGQSEATAVR